MIKNENLNKKNTKKAINNLPILKLSSFDDQ
jgi:hypothetical protein